MDQSLRRLKLVMQHQEATQDGKVWPYDSSWPSEEFVHLKDLYNQLNEAVSAKARLQDGEVEAASEQQVS